MQAKEAKATAKDFGSKVYKMFQLGSRLITITAVDLGNGRFELIYHFSRGAEIVNLKLEVGEDDNIESVTGLYPYADLAESEVLDYFGLRIDGAEPNRFLEEGSGICAPLRKERKPEGESGGAEDGAIEKEEKREGDK